MASSLQEEAEGSGKKEITRWTPRWGCGAVTEHRCTQARGPARAGAHSVRRPACSLWLALSSSGVAARSLFSAAVAPQAAEGARGLRRSSRPPTPNSPSPPTVHLPLQDGGGLPGGAGQGGRPGGGQAQGHPGRVAARVPATHTAGKRAHTAVRARGAGWGWGMGRRCTVTVHVSRGSVPTWKCPLACTLRHDALPPPTAPAYNRRPRPSSPCSQRTHHAPHH